MTSELTTKPGAQLQSSWDYILVIFIYLSIFINSFVFFKQPFEFYLGYLVFLVLLPVFVVRYGVNRDLFFIFVVLLVAGLFNVFVGTNTAGDFLKVYVGLTLSYFFYYYVIVQFDFDLGRLFRWYLKGSYIVAVLGIVQFLSFRAGFKPGYDYSWFLNKWSVIPGGTFGIRVNSVFSEPTFLGTTLSAAFFVSLHNLIRGASFGIKRHQAIVIVAAYLLSFSALGQIGIFLTLLLLAVNFGLVRYILLVIPLGLLLFNYLHENVPDFRQRYDSMIHLYQTGEFRLGETHGSSFILYNNAVVAFTNFKSHFLFGTGIGSHPVAFEKYSIGHDIPVWGLNLNSADANSMFLRLVSETGLFGVLLFFIVIVKCYVVRNEHVDSPHWLISNGILVMILLNLFRQGHYFLNGFPFFFLMYYFNYYKYREYLETLDKDTVPDESSSVALTSPEKTR